MLVLCLVMCVLSFVFPFFVLALLNSINTNIQVGAVVRYVKKYFPDPGAQDLVLVTVCPSAYSSLISSLTAYTSTLFHSCISAWTCLAWLVMPQLRLRAVSTSNGLLPLLQQASSLLTLNQGMLSLSPCVNQSQIPRCCWIPPPILTVW